ncbi:MAG TPA: endonuclease/exonuclease/phosphatase family protein [Caulobacteraceae bacterium]|nr:endonuclease/exonuclease/phosphatase family protein [Caulobacteraceae bacterium]
MPAKTQALDNRARMVRILTYNVHRCVGVDRKLDVGRVAAVIAAQEPDIVALQELDVGRARTGGVDQAHEIARRLGMTSHFNAALRVEEEQYGDAILTDLPERLVKAGPLPTHPRLKLLEPRGAVWVALRVGGAELHVIATHLGLVPREQRLQAAALAGADWVGAAPPGAPMIVLGDMNAAPRTVVYRTFAAHLTEARRSVRATRLTPTFPSTFPVLPIDHVFVSRAIEVKRVRTPLDQLSRLASDHLPLVVDFRLRAPPASA